MAKEISRRALFTGGAAAVSAAALASIMGCAPKVVDKTTDSDGTENATTPEAGAEVREYPTRVFETDVLVVGGGYAGCMASIRAMQCGAKVIVLDKGEFAHSGTTGYNWGSMYTSYDMSTDDPTTIIGSATAGKVRAASGTCDENITAALMTEMVMMRPSLFMENLGAFHERLEDGRPGNCVMGSPMISDKNRCIAGQFGKFYCHKVKRMGADVHERTMLVDLLTAEDGSVAGGVALNLVSGDIEVYRAKSVVMATGSYNWICGWTGWRPQSMIGPECTGDGFAIMMKNGVPVGNNEFVCTDFDAYNPGCLRDTFTVGLEYPDCERAVNSEGEYFALDYLTAHPDQGGIETLTQLVAGEVVHGRGSEHGGVWLDTKDWSGQEMELVYRTTPYNLERNFGYTLPDKVEVVADHWCSGSTPQVTTSMETSMPGLFFAGYASMSCDVTGILASGSLAGYGAAGRAATVNRPFLNVDQVNAILDHTYDLLERQPEDGITAIQVQHEIQKAYGAGLDMLRSEESITAALDEFKRIKTEDLPRMYVPSKSKVMNNEWRHAIEAENMLTIACAAGIAALERRESRFHHVRTDYPAWDNSEDNLKMIMVSMDENGELTATRRKVDNSFTEAMAQSYGITQQMAMNMLLSSTNINSREQA